MANEPKFELPGIDQRVSVMGRTGSGKTQFGVWLLSLAPFHRIPYIIIDFKGDRLLTAIDRAREIGLGEVPKHPGLYITHPLPPPDNDDEIDGFLREIWKRENTGLYFDEAYLVPDRGPFRAILTQGRSKTIPAIVVTQRPAYVSRFAFTEADHFALFHLQHSDDHKKVRGFIPEVDLSERLPKYNSRWYNVDQDHLYDLGPVPDADEIIGAIDKRLQPKRKWF